MEDCAVYLLGPDRVMLFTTDFFTPIVDDPRAFGQIAVANALSDIYAMGGIPELALNLAAFPIRRYGTEALSVILEGGASKAREAGCLLAGGHTIDDPEPKYGLAAIGFADPGKLIRKDGAHPGDRLYLTKTLGTGILATALKNGLIGADGMADAVASMTVLNDKPSRFAVEAGVRAGTDVTGFGLLGHLWELCSESGVSASVRFSSLPFFEGVEELAEAEEIPGGTYANREGILSHVAIPLEIPEHRLLMACDAQTSGGLLLSIPPEGTAVFEKAMETSGLPFHVIGAIGEPPAAIHLEA